MGVAGRLLLIAHLVNVLITVVYQVNIYPQQRWLNSSPTQKHSTMPPPPLPPLLLYPGTLTLRIYQATSKITAAPGD